MSLQNVRLPSIQLTVGGATPQVTGVTPSPGQQTADAVNQQIINQQQQKPPPPMINPLGPQPNQVVAVQPNLADTDPATVDYYEVRVDQVLYEHQVKFSPGQVYKVAPHIFLDNCDDGSAFADHCTVIAIHPKVTGE
jgi:hypothetical protein